jgi:hypothetical protein
MDTYTVKMITEGYGRGYFAVVNEKGSWFGGLQTSYTDAQGTATRLNLQQQQQQETLKRIEQNGISW